MWIVVTTVGLILATWAYLTLPENASMMPVPARGRHLITRKGPYRFLKHPMYVGNVMFVSGLAGLNGGRYGGIFAALAVGFTAEMLMRFWAGLERG